MGSDFVKALLLAPHPDDEVLGAGIWLRRHRDRELHVVHVTDGSPLDMQDAHAQGFGTRQEYASVRKGELRAALDLIPIPVTHCAQLPFVDKETFRDLVGVAEAVDEAVARVEPEIVLAPAYEGGHPDHDATAFAAAMVWRQRESFRLLEFPLYHAGEAGDMVIGEFAGGGGASEEVIALSAEEREMKRAMLASFPSQQDFLSHFPIANERFRPAPAYDFTEPPHPGALLYERWGWGISGENWRKAAKEATRRLTGRSVFCRRRSPSILS